MLAVYDKLFVYGTLREAIEIPDTPQIPIARYLHLNSRKLGYGYFNGKLYNLGGYPGATHHPGTSDRVHGDIFQLINPETVFLHLDKYEEIGPMFPEPHEYIRKIIPMHWTEGQNEHKENRRLDCWVYLYNLSTKNIPLIRDGIFKL